MTTHKVNVQEQLNQLGFHSQNEKTTLRNRIDKFETI